MTNRTVPYLCGGTFLCQVLRARNLLTTATDHTNSNKESLSEQETFRRLISIYQLSDFYGGTSLKTYTSIYKSCKDSLIAYAQFCDSDMRLAFDSAVKVKNSTALHMMSNFVSEFIDIKDKGEQLVRCLLGMIKDDDNILPNDKFFIENGKAVIKAKLTKIDSFTIEPFLLGIWHYIIIHRADKNKSGADTYKSWYISRDNYRGTVGNDITRSITVKSAPTVSPIIEAKEVTDEQKTNEEQVKAEYTENIQHIEQATIVNQYGDQCIHIDHVGVLNL